MPVDNTGQTRLYPASTDDTHSEADIHAAEKTRIRAYLSTSFREQPIYHRELSVFLHTVSGYFSVQIEAARPQRRCHNISWLAA